MRKRLMIDALTLAKYIVSKCVQDDCPISNLQLQKILYYIQMFFLQEKDTPAFYDDIEAWQFGPVVPIVYYHFCGFGAMPIFSTYEITPPLEDKEKIDSIVEEKRILKPWELVEETHRPDGAWSRVYRNGAGDHEVIPADLIKKG